MAFGLDKHGFKRKRYVDIRKDLAKKWKEMFGENSRTDEKSVNGIIISLIAYVASPLWMLAEKVYNSGFVHKSDGVSLSGLVRNRLMKRRASEKSIGKIEITGEEGTIVEAGFRVMHKVEYVTKEDVEIGSSGTVFVKIEAVNAGSKGNTPANTITEIVTPVVGVDSVINPDATHGGREEEADAELKERYDRSFATGGSSTTASIEAALLGLERVRDAKVYENTTMEEVNGIPPKSIAPFVYGGSDNDIAQAIYEIKAGGMQSFGSIEKIVTDSRGETHTIGFNRPGVIDLFVEAEIETDGDFPINGEKEVKTKIIEYVGGQDEDATEYTGLGLGKSVIYTKIIAAIQEVPGIVDIPVLKIGTQSSPTGTDNVEISSEEVALTDSDKVAISSD